MKTKRILLLGLVAAGLLLIGFISMSNIGIVNVSATQWTGLKQPVDVAISDYDNDGLNDIAFTEYGVGEADDGMVTVYKNDATTIIKNWTGLVDPSGVAIGDANNDGLNDIAFTDTNTGVVYVYASNGTLIKQWTGLSNPEGVAIGDYNNDGLNEIIFPELGAGVIYMYSSNGTLIKQWSGLNGPYRVAIGDYDNDGLNDLAFTEYNIGKVTVERSDGTVIKQWTGLNLPYDVAIGDYNNDGFNDLAFTEPDAGVMVYKSDGTTVIRQLTGLNGLIGVAIGDYNNDGLNDLAIVWGGVLAGKMIVYYQTMPGTVARVAEPTIVTLRGTLTNASGYPIQSGSIRVTIKDSFGTQVWQDIFNNTIDNGRYSIPLGTKTTLMLIKGQIYNAILEVDADSPTFISADVIYGDNNPTGDLIKFVAN